MTILRNVSSSTSAADAIDTINAVLKGGPNPRLVTMLDSLLAGQSQMWTVFPGDSITVDDTLTAGAIYKRGFIRVVEQIAATLGSGVRVVTRQWRATETWEDPRVLQAGTNGRRGVYYDGDTTNCRCVGAPASAFPMGSVSADFQVNLPPFKPAAYPPAAVQYLFNKSSASNRCCYANIQTNGDIQFSFHSDSTDGSIQTITLTAANASVSTNAINEYRFRVTSASGAYVVQKGNGNGGGWTTVQSGTLAITPAILVRTGTAPWELGGRAGGGTSEFYQGGNANLFVGTLYDGWNIFDGIDGAPMLPHSVESLQNTSGNALTVGSPTLYVMLGGVAGRDLHYALGLTGNYTTATDDGSNRKNKLVWPGMPGLLTGCDGGNEQGTTNHQWLAALDLWYNFVTVRNPWAVLSFIIEHEFVLASGKGLNTAAANKSTAAAKTQIYRQRQLQGWCARRGIITFDTASELANQPGITLIQLLSLDGVHPNIPGNNETDNGLGYDGYKYWAYPLCRAFGVPLPPS